MHYTSNLDILLCMPVAFVYIPLTWIPTCSSLLHSPCTWHVHLFSCSRSQHAMLIKCDLLKHGIFFFFLFLNNRYQNIEGFGHIALFYSNILSNQSVTATIWKYVVNTCQLLLSPFFAIAYIVSRGLGGWNSSQIKLPSDSGLC